MYEMELESHYKRITTEDEAESFGDLPGQVQEDLTEWYNVRKEDMDDNDRGLLYQLYIDGKFRAWDCPKCGRRVYRGDPDSYDNFQGVWNQDFCSFPGNSGGKFTEEYLAAMCDYCRADCKN